MRIEIEGLEPFEIDDSASEETVQNVVKKLTAEQKWNPNSSKDYSKLEDQWGQQSAAPVAKPSMEEIMSQPAGPGGGALPEQTPDVQNAEEFPGWNKLPELSALFASHDPSGREDMIQQAVLAGMPSNAISTGLGAAKSAAKAVSRGIGSGSTKQAARLMGVSPNAPEATTAMEHGINLASGSAEKTIAAKQSEIWPKITGLVDEATKSGKSIPKTVITDSIEEMLHKVSKVEPGGPQVKQLTRYLKEAQNYPSTLTPEEAQAIKQHLGQVVRNWDKSMIKDAATAGRTAGQRAVRGKLNAAVGETTSDPKLYSNLNKKYGDLSSLFAESNRGGALQPAEAASAKMASMNPISAAKEKLVQPINKARYAIGKWGKIPETEESLGGMLGVTSPSKGTSPKVTDPKTMIEDLGLHFKGQQTGGPKALRHRGELVYFDDPMTDSTLAMFTNEMTPESIARHVAESRAKFHVGGAE